MLSINNINKQEVFRYLGIRGKADENTEKLFYECEKLLLENISPRYIMSCFDIEVSENVSLLGTNMCLEGESIKAHLLECSRVVLFCVTLSSKADLLIRQMQVSDLAKGVIIDCCASAAVEQLCDLIQEQLINDYVGEGEYITSRFSPGYGDLSIEIQGEFLNLLDAPRKIGLSASQNNILMPRKSVTAIVGISDKPQKKLSSSCDACNMEKTCEFRKRGEHCGL